MSTLSSQCVDLILSAIFHPYGRGATCSFMFGDRDSPVGMHTGGGAFYHDEMKMLDAVLLVRERGPLYLRRISPRKIESQLTKFVICLLYTSPSPRD